MITISDTFVNSKDVQFVISKIKEIPDYLWTQRTGNLKNISIDGSEGVYMSLFSDALPDDIGWKLYEMAPKHHEYEVRDIIINKYNQGDYIPPHKDNTDFLLSGLMFLSEQKVFRYYEDNKPISVEDKIGRTVIFKDNSLVHEVLQCNEERYSVVYLYI
jgi:hypothetical protein